jgi:hypothetical protein
MKRLEPRLRISHLAVLASFVLAALMLTGQARAFDLARLLADKPDNFKTIDVAELSKLMADPNSHVNIYDANGSGLRDTAGVIPGAHLLSSDDSYNVATELPADHGALLVFYCADKH